MRQAVQSARAYARESRQAPRLRVVPRPVTKAPTRRGGKGRHVADARLRALFTSSVALLVALTGVGLVRVAVVARAAEMTINADRLTQRIKAQRIETDKLEIDRSSLSTPSRIEGIASETMRMGSPASVRYISLPTSGAGGARVAQVPAASARGASADPAVAAAASIRTSDVAPDAGGAPQAVSAAISALIDMSAGEAQALLLGDIGLVGSR
ncbi:MAG TPA: cell division protein FtsL [Coriobacteriia bacterium]